MKKILAIGLGVVACVVLLIAGVILFTPDDELAAMVRPLPAIGAYAEDVVELKSDVTSSMSNYVDDTVYGVASTWRRITGFSLTDRTQRVIIELEPVRTKKMKMPKPPAAPAAPEPAPAPRPSDQSMPQMTAPVQNMQASETPNPAPDIDNSMAEALPGSQTDTASSAELMPEASSAPAAPSPAAPKMPAVDKAMQAPTATAEMPEGDTPDQINEKEEPQQTAAVLPIKTTTSKPTPIRKPPPPAPKTDEGSAEHKKGLTYYKGIGGVAKNYKTAATWFRQSSAKGNAASQYNLGIMAYLGQGVDQSYEEAAKWFQQAASQDHALAQYNLGFLFYEGKGVEKDDLQAFMWIDRAARLGDEKAIKARDTLENILPKDILQAR